MRVEPDHCDTILSGGETFDGPDVRTAAAAENERPFREVGREREAIEESGVAVYTISDIDRRGVEPVLQEALGRVSGAPFVHVSVDLDLVDPGVAPGVGSPVKGGLSYREAHLAMELVAESELLTSLELVEVNPILDHENATAKLAVDLAASALGARIL